jgi:hypothetical protein
VRPSETAEKREGDLLQMQILMSSKDIDEATLHEKRGDSFFARRMYEDAIIEYKKSVALDLTKPAGRSVFLDLAAKADIVWENFRPGVMAADSHAGMSSL